MAADYFERRDAGEELSAQTMRFSQPPIEAWSVKAKNIEKAMAASEGYGEELLDMGLRREPVVRLASENPSLGTAWRGGLPAWDRSCSFS